MSKLRFWLLLLALVSMVIPTGCGAPQTANQPATPTPLPTSVVPLKPTYTVQRGEVIEKFEFTGRLSPVKEEELYFRTGGRLLTLYVKRGDTVTAGQLLAELEGIKDLQRNLQIIELNVKRNEIYLNQAQLDLDLFKLYNNKFAVGYDKQLKMKENDLELAKISLEESRLGYEELKGQVDASQITSPIDGKVLTVTVTQGRGVEAYIPAIIVADVNQLEVIAELVNTDMQKLVEGMQATANLFSKPGTTYDAKIRRLPYPYGGGGTTVTDTDTTTRIELVKGVSSTNWAMGDLIQIVVILNKSENALWVPPQSIRTFGGRKFVVVQDGAVQQRVDVKTGLVGEDKVEILEGLKEGQVIVGP
jgi:macrolide-specific efflux system membrane fusion protein